MRPYNPTIITITLNKLSGGSGYCATLPIPAFKSEVAPDPQLYIEIGVHSTGMESTLRVSRERCGNFYSDEIVSDTFRSRPDGTGGLSIALHDAIGKVVKLLYRRFNKRVKFIYVDDCNNLVTV